MQTAANELTDPQPRQRARPFDPHATIVRPRDLRAMTGLSECQVWRLRKSGAFPQAIRLGKIAIGFYRSEIDAWLAARQQAQ